MSRRRLFELLLLRWGFALLVGIAIASGLVAALTVAPPSDLPNVALRTAIVYRVEVGAAVFLVLYLATMALALALQNSAFTEIGTSGVRARDLAAVSDELIVEDAAVELLAKLVEEIDAMPTRREDDRDVT